jgi:transcriptional regulator with XRE-family HTH domain
MSLPSEVFRARLREVRRAKGLTQQDLAEALSGAGEDLSASAITRMESGHRDVSLDEAIAIAAVLGVSPLHMVVQLDDNSIQLTPRLTVTATDARAWMRGQRPLREADERIFLFQTPPSEADWWPFVPGPWRMENPEDFESVRPKWERQMFFRPALYERGSYQQEAGAMDIVPQRRKPPPQSSRPDAKNQDEGDDYQ